MPSWLAVQGITVSATGYKTTRSRAKIQFVEGTMNILLVRKDDPVPPSDGVNSTSGYALFILTNVSNGSIWVGRESELKTMHTYDFAGGGLKSGDGSRQMARFVKKSPSFQTQDEAKKFFLRSLQSKPRAIPLTGGSKAKIFGGDYWVDLAM
jgi:hypothetical protein